MHTFLSCSVVASKDFEEQKAFNYNEEKGKVKQEKRSLMSNDFGYQQKKKKKLILHSIANFSKMHEEHK